MIFLILIVLISLVEYVGDSNFKFYARDGKMNNLVIGIISYAILIKLLISALKESNLIFTNSMWDGISAIISTLFAYFLLKERLNNKFQWTGLILVILGVLLLNFGKIPK